ncbi:MAG: MFS transporter [Bdellovibrionales bacterium]|nr:MFS transporter [Bdellovibrionales bacterium]
MAASYTFRDTLLALRQRKMVALLLLGMSSGLPFALTLGTLQAWMKDFSIDLKTIGLFAFLRLPFSVKFLWAPLMDRFTLPLLDRRRGWTLITQLLVALCLVGMAMTNPATQIQQLLIFTLLVNLFSASQDIVLDAYRREVLEEHELGLGVGIFVNGYLVAFRYISGALALLLPGWLGVSWGQVYLFMALLMVLFALATIAAPPLDETKQAQAPKSLTEAFVGPIREYFSRPEAFTVLAFIILYKVGDSMASTMTLPFILGSGFSREEYVAIVKVWGPIATFVGALVGGHYVLKWGIQRSLWAMGFLQAASTALFATITWAGKNNWVLAGVVGFENLTAQMGTAAYASYMGSITNVRFTATQYALLSSLMAVPGVLFSSRTGEIAGSIGWNNFFFLCAFLAIPGMFLIPLMSSTAPITGWKNWCRRLVILATVCAGIYALGASAWDIGQLFVKK